MVARLNKQEARGSTQLPTEHPRVIYDSARREEHPFPDPELLYRVYSDQQENICKAAESMIQTFGDNGMSAKHSKELGTIVQQHINIFRKSLSLRLLARVALLKITLSPDARRIRV